MSRFWVGIQAGQNTLNGCTGREDGVRPGVTAAESAEPGELKKRNRLLEQEKEILRRAAAFFARESLPK